MTCAKHITKAALYTRGGAIFHGRNDCLSPQPTCPRVGNEGYAKCGTICRQPWHAEVHCVIQAMERGHDVHGAHMKVFYDHVCADCQTLMAQYNITWELCQ